MQFTYVTYIFGTTPQRVYQALTERADYDAYLGTTGPQSTWAVGDTVFWKSLPEGDFEDLGQEVLEADPGVALAYTWYGVQPAHRRFFASDAAFAASQSERSVVRFSLIDDPELAAVRLHLTHEGFDSADSVMLHRVSEGWPKIVSALKTWLESPKAPQE